MCPFEHFLKASLYSEYNNLGFISLCSVFLQQSVAFKILRTRLKTVPFSENLRRTSSANPYSQILQVTEDGNRNQDTQNYSAINFPSLLQQFENMQQQHRNHLKGQLQSRKSASAATLLQVFSFCSHIWLSRYCLFLQKKTVVSSLQFRKSFWNFCSLLVIFQVVLLFYIWAKYLGFLRPSMKYQLVYISVDCCFVSALTFRSAWIFHLNKYCKFV